VLRLKFRLHCRLSGLLNISRNHGDRNGRRRAALFERKSTKSNQMLITTEFSIIISCFPPLGNIFDRNEWQAWISKSLSTHSGFPKLYRLLPRGGIWKTFGSFGSTAGLYFYKQILLVVHIHVTAVCNRGVTEEGGYS